MQRNKFFHWFWSQFYQKKLYFPMTKCCFYIVEWKSWMYLRFRLSWFGMVVIGFKMDLCFANDPESISPTFFELNWANFLVPIKSLTFTSSTKKLRAKLLFKKAAGKILVKLAPQSHSKKNQKWTQLIYTKTFTNVESKYETNFKFKWLWSA